MKLQPSAAGVLVYILYFLNLLEPNYNLLITLATHPAPNPLSMFTTLTFDAQLFNIASSAVNPPKLEP